MQETSIVQGKLLVPDAPVKGVFYCTVVPDDPEIHPFFVQFFTVEEGEQYASKYHLMIERK